MAVTRWQKAYKKGIDEQIDDTLVQRVMKKVKELKLWKLKNSKQGFETVYKDVLAEAEELPESVVCIMADCGYSSAKEIIKKVIRDT